MSDLLRQTVSSVDSRSPLSSAPQRSFDRLIIATAQEHRFTLLTPDPKIHAYADVSVFW